MIRSHFCYGIEIHFTIGSNFPSVPSEVKIGEFTQLTMSEVVNAVGFISKFEMRFEDFVKVRLVNRSHLFGTIIIVCYRKKIILLMERKIQTLVPTTLRPNNTTSNQSGRELSPLRKVDLKTSEVLRARRTREEPGHVRKAGFKGLIRSSANEGFQSFIFSVKNSNAEDIFRPLNLTYSLITSKNNPSSSQSSNQSKNQSSKKTPTDSENPIVVDPSPKKIRHTRAKPFATADNRINLSKKSHLGKSQANKEGELNELHRSENNEDDLENFLKQLKDPLEKGDVKITNEGKELTEAKNMIEKTEAMGTVEPISTVKIQKKSNM